MSRYEVMHSWSEGFVAGINPNGGNVINNEHWQAGYTAGYKARAIMNAGLDEYLISIGRKPQAKIVLCRDGDGT